MATARPTSTAWSTRACGPTRSRWNGRTISTPTAASTTTRAGSRCSTRRRPIAGARGLQEQPQPVRARPAAASFGFDEAFNVAAQGKAFSYITYNMFRTAYDDPSQSAVVGKMEIAAVPNGGLNGAWGWAIPNSSPNPDAAWTFLKWIESPEIAKQARDARRLADPHRTCSRIPELNAKYVYYPALRTCSRPRATSRCSPTPRSSSRCWAASCRWRSPARRAPRRRSQTVERGVRRAARARTASSSE